MKIHKIVFWTIILALLISPACESPTDSGGDVKATITGRVTNTSGGGISGARVWDRGNYAPAVTTSSDGSYTLKLNTVPANDEIYASAFGYYPDTMQVAFASGETQKVVNFALLSDAIIPPTGDITAAMYISLGKVSETDLAVSETGGIETSHITYIVKDAKGNAVGSSVHAYTVRFTLTFEPNNIANSGTAPYLIENAVSNDEKGVVTAIIKSGTNAGTVKLRATITIGTVTINSDPVPITVHGGFASQNRFTINPKRFVFPGFIVESTSDFTVTAGDTFSNPVKIGTAILFGSQAGVIQTGNTDFKAYTNASGQATVSLIYGVKPFPTAPPYCDLTIRDYTQVGSPPVNRIGYQWVYAQTQGRYGVVVDSVFVVWSQGPIRIAFNGAAPTPYSILNTVVPTITLPAGGTSATNTFTVVDFNGNPLSNGTKIYAYVDPIEWGISTYSFSVNGNIGSPQKPTIIPNAHYARFPGDGITNFVFSVTGGNGLGAGNSTTLHIIVESEVDNFELKIPVTLY